MGGQGMRDEKRKRRTVDKWLQYLLFGEVPFEMYQPIDGQITEALVEAGL
jgi:hypothetical protein